MKEVYRVYSLILYFNSMLSFIVRNISSLIVVGFLLFTLVVGLYFSRKKITTLREYAVGNKQFSGGGGLIRTVEQVHFRGLYWISL